MQHPYEEKWRYITLLSIISAISSLTIEQLDNIIANGRYITEDWLRENYPLHDHANKSALDKIVLDELGRRWVSPYDLQLRNILFQAGQDENVHTLFLRNALRENYIILNLLGIIAQNYISSEDFKSDFSEGKGWRFWSEQNRSMGELDQLSIRYFIQTLGAVIKHSINSEDFISGFPAGKGWAILMRDKENAAGEIEQKSYAELDELTIRGSLRVFEFIINQLKGESDNYIFSGMMKVEKVDLQEKKIYLDTGGGLLYNPFRSDDYLMCQRYNGANQEIIKNYELIVSDAGSGDLSDGEDRLDWIVYRNFSGDQADIQKGDILVRVDNLTDPDRKGILMNTTVGPFAPYMDAIYGLKTDPDNAVKSRFGNLEGIYNHFFGWLKGYGSYIQNLYAVGEFRMKNGEDIQTSLEILNNLFRVGMQKTVNQLTEEDNFLYNATFTEEMEGWKKTNQVAPYRVGGKLLMLNRNLYTVKDQVAAVTEYDGRNMLRIKNSGIRQSNELIRKPEKDSVLYMSFTILCTSAGRLTIGFERKKNSRGRRFATCRGGNPGGYRIPHPDV